jgi:ABC-type lipoprotein export system ATPase subunit
MIDDFSISAKNINKSFHFENHEIKVLEDISLSIKHGAKIGLFGPSGSGKSTLLYILGLLDTADSGFVSIANENANAIMLQDDEKSLIRRKQIGFIYQSPFLLSDFTVEENIILPAKIAGIKNFKSKSHELMERLNILNIKNKYPDMLSGGQKQRVSIARACVKNPAIIFADEPTASLDFKNANIVLDLFFETVKFSNSALLMVTHNTLLKDRFDECYIFDNGTLKKYES